MLEANVYGASIPHHEGRADCTALFIAPERRERVDWRGLAQDESKGLPRYAVQIFLRVLSGEVECNAPHKHKQIKMGSRAESVADV